MNLSWNAPPTQLLLSRKDVHIWQANIDLPSNDAQNLKKNLSSDERTKAENFRFERDRSRFIAARGILRQILARYLNIEPSVIRFCYEKNGKPKLQNSFGMTDIQFNLSHSEGLALYVFTLGHDVGIDVEYVHEISEMEQIVEQFFSDRERAFFCTLPASKKKETFFNWWTRKEAFTKTTGNGLSHPLDMFDVSVTPGEPAELLKISENAQKGPEWSMWDVRPGEAFVGAVVVEGAGRDVQCWQWQGKRNVSYERITTTVHSFKVRASVR